MNMVRTWLIDTKLPPKLWGELFTHAVHVYSHCPHTTLNNRSPASVLFAEGDRRASPNLKYLHEIGTKVTMNVASEGYKGKLGARAVVGWYVGASINQPGIRMWADETDEVFASSHVQVFSKVHYKDHRNPKEEFFCAKESSPAAFTMEDESQDGPDEWEYVPAQILDEIYEDGIKKYKVRWEGFNESGDTYEPFENIGHTEVFKRWENPNEEAQILSLASEDTPTLQQAMKRADKELWLDAMQAEFDALEAQATWEIVPRPMDRKVISVKWVLRIKWDKDRKLPTYKGRMCARGFTQVQNVDYEDTFSPTLSKTGLRLLLALAVQLGMKIHAIDCKNAFLNGNIDKEIYIEQPPYFIKEGTTAQSHVCRLKKALYGLKQAPLIWCQTLKKVLVQTGFEQMEYEPCIFIKRSDTKNITTKRQYDVLGSWDDLVKNPDFCILGVYVDDITIISMSEDSIQKAKAVIQGAFSIKDEGQITKIIGVEVDQIAHGLVLTQRSFLTEVLARQGMEKCNMNRIPMEPDSVTRLTGESDAKPIENHWYRSIVGELLYATVCTRPDLSFAVNLCARAVEKPTTDHEAAIKKILRYVKAFPDVGLVYKKSGKPLRLVAYSDSDFATDKSCSKSTTGYVICLNGCAVSWCTSKQKAVSLSTVEAEYIAACQAVKEVMWIQYLLAEIIGTDTLQCPLLLLDSAGAEALAQNEGVSNKTKHIRYCHHFIRQCAEHKLIAIRHIEGAENPADMLTKPLAHAKFSKFCEAINVMTGRRAIVNKVFTKRGYLEPLVNETPKSKKACWEI
jgi:hypothetical protein